MKRLLDSDINDVNFAFKSRVNSTVSTFVGSYYKKTFDISTFLKILLVSNSSNKAKTLFLLNNGNILEFLFKFNIKNHGIEYKNSDIMEDENTNNNNNNNSNYWSKKTVLVKLDNSNSSEPVYSTCFSTVESNNNNVKNFIQQHESMSCYKGYNDSNVSGLDLPINDIYVVLNSIKLCILNTIKQTENLCEIHFTGFRSFPTTDYVTIIGKSLDTHYKYNFVLDLDLGKDSNFWELIGNIDRDSIKNRTNVNSLWVDNLVTKYSKMVFLLMGIFSNILIMSLRIYDVRYFIMSNNNSNSSNNNTKDKNDPYTSNMNAIINNNLTKNLEDPTYFMSNSLYNGKKSGDVFKIFFSGSRGIHVWFDQVLQNGEKTPQSIKAIYEHYTYKIEHTLSVHKDTLSWIDSILSGYTSYIVNNINSTSTQTNNSNIGRILNKHFKDVLGNMTFLMVNVVDKFELAKLITEYTQVIPGSSISCHMNLIENEMKKNTNGGIPNIKSYLRKVYLSMLKIWLAGFSKNECINILESTEVPSFDSLIEKIVMCNITRDHWNFEFLKKILIGMIILSPLLVMDFGIYSKNHSIRIPGSLNAKTNLPSFEIKKWDSYSGIEEDIKENIKSSCF